MITSVRYFYDLKINKGITITNDLTVKQIEKVQGLISETRSNEECDQQEAITAESTRSKEECNQQEAITAESTYHGAWHIMKIMKNIATLSILWYFNKEFST